LLEEVLTLKGAVRVFCRVRPPTAEESLGHKPFVYPGTSKECTAIHLVEPPTSSLSGVVKPSKVTEFAFNRVFSPIATQEDIFEEARALVSSMADGNRVCIFAYGQTGSGKTFTMQGPDAPGGSTGPQRGLIPRSLQHLFKIASNMTEDGWNLTFAVECVEIYNETFRDLLTGATESEPRRRPLDLRYIFTIVSACDSFTGDARIEVRQDAKSGLFRLSNITSIGVESAERVRR
jgi:kinesin family member C1